jgi:hypothetical protein
MIYSGLCKNVTLSRKSSLTPGDGSIFFRVKSLYIREDHFKKQKEVIKSN